MVSRNNVQSIILNQEKIFKTQEEADFCHRKQSTGNVGNLASRNKILKIIDEQMMSSTGRYKQIDVPEGKKPGDKNHKKKFNNLSYVDSAFHNKNKS